MVLVAVSVRDAKSEAFGRPFFVVSIGSAIRSFDDEVNRAAEDNSMYRHPEDYSLWQLGTWDDQDGSYVSLSPCKMLVQGSEVRREDSHRSPIGKV